ncbi:MAG: NTP transferase domain-containing protein [Geminicoccaceae bacterium]
MTGEETTTALVLAGSRRGEADPVARYRHAPAKFLVPAGGVPMLARVVRTLRRSRGVGRILISCDDPALVDQMGELHGIADLDVLRSAASLSASVEAAFAAAGPPLLVTTADHALLDPAMVELFLERAGASGADVAAALVAAATIRASHPDTRRTYLRFRDGGYSGANLFLLRTTAAAEGIAFWRRIERDRKAPWRLARAVGPLPLLSYLLRVATLAQAMRLVSRRLGLHLSAVVLPMAEAAIDVDKPADLDLVERILASRGGTPA